MDKKKTFQSYASSRQQAAFTLVESLVTVLMMAVLVGWVGFFFRKTRTHSKANVCMTNLKELGVGLAMYEKQNNDKLPLACIMFSGNQHVTWDGLITSYMRAELRGKDLNNPPPPPAIVDKLMLCPVDTIPSVTWGTFHPKRRTYAMPGHNMSDESWPPGSNNVTGVGLRWAYFGQGNDSTKHFATDYTNGVPAVRLGMILEAGDTMALTECAFKKNILGNSSGAYIQTTSQHLDTKALPMESYHAGKFSYLMVDGHVDRLFPDQTVGQMGGVGDKANTHRGLWTIQPGD